MAMGENMRRAMGNEGYNRRMRAVSAHDAAAALRRLAVSIMGSDRDVASADCEYAARMIQGAAIWYPKGDATMRGWLGRTLDMRGGLCPLGATLTEWAAAWDQLEEMAKEVL